MDFYEAFARYANTSSSTWRARVYPVTIPQDAYDSNQTSGLWKIREHNPNRTHDNLVTDGSAIIQFDLYSKDIAELDGLINDIKNTFITEKFILGSDDNGSITLCYCNTSNEFDEFESDQGLYIRSIDLNIKYIKN